MVGTWEFYGSGRVTVAKDSGTFSTIGKTGGSQTHTLTINQIPAHSHTLDTQSNKYANATYWARIVSSGVTGNEALETSSVGDGQAHNNLQPYIVVYRYRRIA